ncbi:MAG: hypothetical protein LBC41_08120, partial [Clostridiales bacterium]|nr:hypothetical protein [Clostridiales bacterium]
CPACPALDFRRFSHLTMLMGMSFHLAHSMLVTCTATMIPSLPSLPYPDFRHFSPLAMLQGQAFSSCAQHAWNLHDNHDP